MLETNLSNCKKFEYVCIPRSFLVTNICNQGKTLCSPCIIRDSFDISATQFNILFLYSIFYVLFLYRKTVNYEIYIFIRLAAPNKSRDSVYGFLMVGLLGLFSYAGEESVTGRESFW